VSLRVGESLQAGIRLVEIAGDHVVIESGEGRQRLGFGTGQAATQVQTSLPSAAPAAPTAPSALDPARLLEQAGLAPRETNGLLSGYTVIPRGDGALLRQAGLQAGDVLLSVNGQTLTPERYQDLTKELAGRPSLQLTFERDGASQSITVPLQ
jgi:general secretion pathway protein C